MAPLDAGGTSPGDHQTHPPTTDPVVESSRAADGNDNDDARAEETVRGSSTGDGTDAADASSDASDGPRRRQASLTRIHTAIDENEQSELRRIATALSVAEGRADGEGPGDGRRSSSYNDDDALNPQSSRFDLAAWLQDFVRDLRGQGHTGVNAGVVYQDLDVSGGSPDLQVQQTVASFLKAPLRLGSALLRLGLGGRGGGGGGKAPRRKILQRFDGFLQGGELLVVLGRPGSGCSTLLKTMCGELHGLHVDEGSTIHYNGVPQKKMIKEFKGEVVYNQEVDKHFPELTVGQTLEFAASVRMPSHRFRRMPRAEAARYIARVVTAVCGLRHAYHTKVGNEFVRGVSGGERKRVSIAEMMVAGSPMCAWDNSTRGLDSATALRFVQTLRTAADLTGSAHVVAIYQAGESIYELFDKAAVLYEGRQIYFGPAAAAKAFFERQGWLCPPRQTTGDFLTSVTNPAERRARPGMEHRVPRTAAEFEACWRRSPEFRALRDAIARRQREFPVDPHGPTAAQLRHRKTAFQQARHVPPASPYTVSLPMQIAYNTRRAYQRIRGDPTPPLTTALTCVVLALIIGSAVYGTPDATAGFYTRGSVLFMAVLLNALITITEITSLYAQRPVVEKHASYAFYHPAAEAVAGLLADVPIKFVVACLFNPVLYFLAGLRREPGPFFIYFLVSYTATFTMAAVFRTMAALTRTVSQAMSLAGVFVLALVIYTGFVVAVPEMHPWFGWIRWINPLFYAFEALVANEFHGREFPCSVRVPAYDPRVAGDHWICSVVGAVAGRPTVSGDAYIEQSFGYAYAHLWRNYGILLAFLVFFMAAYFAATEINTVPVSSGERLVYREGHVPAPLQGRGGAAGGGAAATADEEKASPDMEAARRRTDEVAADPHPDASSSSSSAVQAIPPQRDVFTWRDVVYDIEVRGGQRRRLLDQVSGWVKPGTLTALMGVSGAGKTTLLDVLAQRTTVGVVTGDMLVNGRPRGANFQRSTGYVQQQDLHLETATVRESLRFSARLRQPRSVSTADKDRFVEEVIRMLRMEDFADAVVGVPGEGLNVEQRKLLTIGVELAARPRLLLFLDEPTSGLDSQSSWAICHFLRRLADAGQAVLCTIHQPSAVLFEQFDRLLFLAAGGRTVYFGDIGRDSRTLLDYFAARGARPCGDRENPAEYMLEVVNGSVDAQGRDWHAAWQASAERAAVDAEIERLHDEKRSESAAAAAAAAAGEDEDPGSDSEFAMPFTTQLALVTRRVFQQYWRMPSYVFSKLALGVAAGLFIGFSFFHAKGSLAGTQNVIFSVFQLVTIFTTLVQQIQPLFVTQRSLYEVRERPGKIYSWKAFMIANIVVELPWQVLTGVVTYACFSYPVVGVQSPQRQGLVLLFCVQLFLYASSFAHMCIAALPDAQTAGGVVTLLVMISLIFCGVLQGPAALPGFWIFMYRASPFTYWVAGVVATQVHGRAIRCSARETSVFDPPPGTTCGRYLAAYLQGGAPGTLQNPDATSACRYCQLSVADQYLAQSRIYWGDRWRNYGILWGYFAFNIFVAISTYYVFRVRRWTLPSLARFRGGKKP